MSRTSQQIIDQTEELAAKFAAVTHWQLHSGKYSSSENPRAQQFWAMACIAQEMLTDTDPENALVDVEDDFSVSKFHHLSFDIRGMLRQSNFSELHHLMNIDEGVPMSSREVHDYLLDRVAEGKTIIPACKCDNWHETKGCLGHDEIMAVQS